MSLSSRRRFLNNSIGFAAAMSAGAALAADVKSPGGGKVSTTGPSTKPSTKRKVDTSSLSGSNERVNVAVIGCGGRGQSHIGDLLGLGEHANVVALCDPDAKHLAASAGRVEDESGIAPKTYTDVRKLLEDKEIDAVSIATPNHWHTLGAIWAIQAGKDVYVEKPLSHNVVEGRRLVEFARKYKKVVLHGTQSRSAPGMRRAMQFLHDGWLGRIYLARALCYKARPSIGLCGREQPVPEEIDYDLWCGPASNKPPHRNTPKFGPIHYDWHWFWEYGNGDIGNQGVHQMDIAMWGLNRHDLPSRVQCVGGRFGYIDDAETPNTQIATLAWGDGAEIIFEVRGLKSKPLPGTKDGVCNIFYGSEGTMVCSSSYGKVQVYAPDGSPIEMPQYDTGPGGNHFVSFIKSLHTRKLDFHAGECEAGHLSSAACHLANISYRAGTKAPFNGERKAFGDDAAAYATLERLESHLGANGVPLESTDYIVGADLQIDPKTERILGNDAANRMLTREYRAPFTVPDHVA